VLANLVATATVVVVIGVFPRVTRRQGLTHVTMSMTMLMICPSPTLPRPPLPIVLYRHIYFPASPNFDQCFQSLPPRDHCTILLPVLRTANLDVTTPTRTCSSARTGEPTSIPMHQIMNTITVEALLWVTFSKPRYQIVIFCYVLKYTRLSLWT
jgi:hypothetical protein